MKKLSESIWGDIRRRGNGSDEKKEDAFSPDYIDFGEKTTVYWATESLEIDGKVEFQFNEVKNYNNNGWRLPTIEECGQVDWEKAKNNIIWLPGGWRIRIDRHELLLKKSSAAIRMMMWTSEENYTNKRKAYAYGFHDAFYYFLDDFYKSTRMFVLLVKDK